jgi:2,4-dienoyl-CoA reductase-like NADH-dependent reductase (Old Yellow Enzyme family)
MSRPLLFTPIALRGLTLKNRVVVAPMHQYAAVDGFVTDWHLMNAGRFAAGGAGMVMVESTKVERRGCGTLGDTGLWDDAQVAGMKRVADFIRANGATPAIQLGHSGRKARRFRPWEGGAPLHRTPEIADWDAWELVAPSALPAVPEDPTQRAFARRIAGAGRTLGGGGAPGPCRRIRGSRDSRRPWLPAPPVLLAARQPAQR